MKAEESKNDPVTGLPTQDLPPVLDDMLKQAEQDSKEHMEKLKKMANGDLEVSVG